MGIRVGRGGDGGATMEPPAILLVAPGEGEGGGGGGEERITRVIPEQGDEADRQQ